MADLPSTPASSLSVAARSEPLVSPNGMDRLRVVEKNELPAAPPGTQRAIVQTSPALVIMKLQSYSTAMYAKLGDEVDYPMNYHLTGAIRLAHSVERMREFEHVVSMANYQGLDFKMMTNDELRAVYPFWKHTILRAAVGILAMAISTRLNLRRHSLRVHATWALSASARSLVLDGKPRMGCRDGTRRNSLRVCR